MNDILSEKDTKAVLDIRVGRQLRFRNAELLDENVQNRLRVLFR